MSVASRTDPLYCVRQGLPPHCETKKKDAIGTIFFLLFVTSFVTYACYVWLLCSRHLSHYSWSVMYSISLCLFCFFVSTSLCKCRYLYRDMWIHFMSSLTSFECEDLCHVKRTYDIPSFRKQVLITVYSSIENTVETPERQEFSTVNYNKGTR